MSHSKADKRGFTLIELLVSVSIFLVVMTISLGSILGIFDANRKSRSLKTVMTNLNLIVESMAKEMRFGKDYHCGAGAIDIPQNCSMGGNIMAFEDSDGAQVAYRLSGTTIERWGPSTTTGEYVRVTAPELIIDELIFYVFGAESAVEGKQPKVIFKVRGHTGTGRGRSDFSLQSMVSQRSLDM